MLVVFQEHSASKIQPRKKVNLKNRKIRTRLTVAGGEDCADLNRALVVGDRGVSLTLEDKPNSSLKESPLVSPSVAVVLSEQLRGVGSSDLENLQSLVAHLDRKDGPVSALEGWYILLIHSSFLINLIHFENSKER